MDKGKSKDQVPDILESFLGNESLWEKAAETCREEEAELKEKGIDTEDPENQRLFEKTESAFREFVEKLTEGW